jgi:hypothetical protein
MEIENDDNLDFDEIDKIQENEEQQTEEI